MKMSNLALTIMLISGVSTTVSAGQLSATPGADSASAKTDQPLPGKVIAEGQQAPAEINSPAVDSPSASAAAAIPPQTFTPEQESRIEVLTHKYLLTHPEILMEISQALENKQHVQQITEITQAVLRNQDSLMSNKFMPSFGPADAKVAFFEFFDYQCSACAKQAPVIASLMNANPQVRYVFEEWPISAPKWTASLSAAETGLKVWQQKGGDAYLAYHNGLFGTGRNEGRLTTEDISTVVGVAGQLKENNDGIIDGLSQTDALAQQLGLSGTPGMIVMPVSGANPENVTVILGGTDQKTLQAAIDKAGLVNTPEIPEEKEASQ